MSLPWENIAKIAIEQNHFIDVQRERVNLLKSFGLATEFDFDKAVTESIEQARTTVHSFRSILEYKIDHLYRIENNRRLK